MDGDGYDFFSQNHGPSVAGFNFLSQGSASGGAYDSTSEQQGVDLNSQALPAGEEFPYLADYGHFIQSGIASHGGQQGPSSRVHAQRPPHTLGVRTPRVRGRGGGMGAAAAGRGRQVNLIPGRSSTGAGGGFGCAPARSAGGRVQHAAAVGRVSGRHRTRACAGHAAAASTVLPQATPTDNYVNLDGDDDESYTYDDHGSSGDHSVSYPRANWTDENNSILLRLCIDQMKAGHYIDGQMSADGYQAIARGFFDQTGLAYAKRQFRNQIGQLRGTYSFWRFLQVHTGLGRKRNGDIDAESEFWLAQTKNKPWLNKLRNGQPSANLCELEELFAGNTVDGSTSYVPGQDYYEAEEETGDDSTADEAAGLVGSPTSTSSRKSKRSIGATTSTADSPPKKTKSPMVKYMKQIASTFTASVKVNQAIVSSSATAKQEAQNKRDLYSLKRCQELAFECGIQPNSNEVYAMGKMFQQKFEREFFCLLPTAEARLIYFKNWCRDHDMI